MKISKLFHWLYAVVMLLPVFAIGVTCGYAMFNKNAYQSFGSGYTEEIITINNSNVNDIFVDGQLINYTFVEHSAQYNSGNFGFDYISIDLNELFNTSGLTYIAFSLYGSNNNIRFIDNNNNSHTILESNRTFAKFTYQVNTTNGNATNIYSYGLAQVITYNQATLSNVFYYSIDKVTQSNLFSWAYNSFLVAPFTYIVALFSMPANSPVVMLLSYWLSISIIWLVFDLIMYIPLLVHRWLDKGVLE